MDIKKLLKPTLLALVGAVVILYNTGRTEEDIVQDETMSVQTTVIDEIKNDTEQFSFPVVLNGSILLNSINIDDTVVNFNFILDTDQTEISIGELHDIIDEVFYEKKGRCDVKEGINTTVQFQFHFHYLNNDTNTVITKPLSFMCGRNINLI